MKNIKKIGGLCAILLTLIYLIGIVMNATMLDTSSISDPIKLVEFVMKNEAAMLIWITLLYIVFGFVLSVLSISLYRLFKDTDSLLNQVALGIGMMWSVLVIGSGMVHNIGMEAAIELFANSPEKAGELYRVIQTVHVGLGGGIEIVGAMWTLLVAVIGFRYNVFSRWANILGVIVGIAGILTIIPPLFDYVIMIFALGQMIWWIGIGINMIKDKKLSIL